MARLGQLSFDCPKALYHMSGGLPLPGQFVPSPGGCHLRPAPLGSPKASSWLPVGQEGPSVPLEAWELARLVTTAGALGPHPAWTALPGPPLGVSTTRKADTFLSGWTSCHGELLSPPQGLTPLVSTHSTQPLAPLGSSLTLMWGRKSPGSGKWPFPCGAPPGEGEGQAG